MIGYVRGIVTHLFKESCYVDVHGVGYRVYVPTTTRQQLIEGQEATLFTYLNVREDAMQLYGFWTEDEYELFYSAHFCFWDWAKGRFRHIVRHDARGFQIGCY